MKLSKLLVALIAVFSLSLNAENLKLTETSNQFSITSKSLSEFIFVNHLSEITTLEVRKDATIPMPNIDKPTNQ